MSDSEKFTDQPGIEPGTFRLRVGYSTNWAIESDREEHWFYDELYYIMFIFTLYWKYEKCNNKNVPVWVWLKGQKPGNSQNMPHGVPYYWTILPITQ